jgi:hypothetical protein
MSMVYSIYDSSQILLDKGLSVDSVKIKYGNRVTSIWRRTHENVDSINELCATYKVDSMLYEKIFTEVPPVGASRDKEKK